MSWYDFSPPPPSGSSGPTGPSRARMPDEQLSIPSRHAGVAKLTAAARLRPLLARPAASWGPEDVEAVSQATRELLAAYDALEALVSAVLIGSLLDVRRAAFSPAMGVRYSESIRADIASACRRLEDECHRILDDR